MGAPGREARGRVISSLHQGTAGAVAGPLQCGSGARLRLRSGVFLPLAVTLTAEP